jgi:hypothetical protein
MLAIALYADCTPAATAATPPEIAAHIPAGAAAAAVTTPASDRPAAMLQPPPIVPEVAIIPVKTSLTVVLAARPLGSDPFTGSSAASAGSIAEQTVQAKPACISAISFRVDFHF